MRTRNAKRRDRAQLTNRAGTPVVGRHPDGGYPTGPSGRFGRPYRRMANAVAHGEFLEREVARAETPAEVARAQAALLGQIAKVERLHYVLTR
jgi:hypothetical protein